MAYQNSKPLQARIKIPAEIFEGATRIQTTTGPSIHDLSNETLSMTCRLIQHPRDQIAFALSSKRLAGIAKDIKLNPVVVAKGKTKKTPFLHRHLLEKLKKWSWIPRDLQLCKRCWKYLPRQRIWKDRHGQELKTLKKVDWIWAVKYWMEGGSICPTCQIPKDYKNDGKSWLQCWPDGFVRAVLVEHKLHSA